MARTDTLGNFLTDIAEAIREKEGTTGTIPASEFDTRISNLSSGGSTTNDYVTNGRLALFDARDSIDANGRWYSKEGNDYWSVTFTDGGATSLSELKTEDAIVSDGTCCIRNNVDYYKDNYTIELVGKADTSYGTNFFTFDKNLSVHINVNRYGEGVFSPHMASATEGTSGFDGSIIKKLNDGKRHTMAINLKGKLAHRATTGGLVTLLFSVDGSPWYQWSYWVSGSGSYASMYSTLLSYYSNSGSGRAPAGSEVNCVRVYNRLLTHKELMQNHILDEKNYGVES